MNREELLKGLSEEQIAKVKACKSPEEILALAKAEGVELTDEQLNAISGGTSICDSMIADKPYKCPKCDCTTIYENEYGWVCNNCNYLIKKK